MILNIIIDQFPELVMTRILNQKHTSVIFSMGFPHVLLFQRYQRLCRTFTHAVGVDTPNKPRDPNSWDMGNTYMHTYIHHELTHRRHLICQKHTGDCERRSEETLDEDDSFATYSWPPLLDCATGPTRQTVPISISRKFPCSRPTIP